MFGIASRSTPAAPFPSGAGREGWWGWGGPWPSWRDRGWVPSWPPPGVVHSTEPPDESQAAPVHDRRVWGDGWRWDDPALSPAFFDGYGGDDVDEESTLGLAVAWRCLQMVSSSIAGLEFMALRHRHGAAPERLDPVPAVLSDPWPQITGPDWRTQVVVSLLLHGNAYCLLADRDPRTAYPRQLPVLHPDSVDVTLTRAGLPRYQVAGGRPLGPAELLHIRGLCLPGSPVGIGVIEALRRGIGSALSVTRYGDQTFDAAGVPSVVLTVDRPELSREQAEELQARWLASHGRNRTPAVVPNAIDVKPLAFSPADQEYLASRKQTAGVELCWAFGVDPRLLGLSAGESLTYSNLEQSNTSYAQFSLQPWTTRMEAALTRVVPRGIEARTDFAPLLRPTTTGRYQAHEIALRSGWMTVDEVREAEGLPPLGAEHSFAPEQPAETVKTLDPDREVQP